MILSKLYSNNPDIFRPIEFAPGINFVDAEILEPKHRDNDTNIFRKPSLVNLIDFMLLSKKDPNLSLFKQYEQSDQW
jgi:uncharacterized protein YydD (DUF2326 family)